MFKIIVFSLIIFSIWTIQINDIDYDINASKLYQSYCVITHCSKDLLINWNCKLCSNLTQLEQTTYIDNQITNVVAFVGYYKPSNSILIIFRGTEDIKNWV